MTNKFAENRAGKTAEEIRAERLEYKGSSVSHRNQLADLEKSKRAEDKAAKVADVQKKFPGSKVIFGGTEEYDFEFDETGSVCGSKTRAFVKVYV